MSTDPQPPPSTRGVKRDAQGHRIPQDQQSPTLAPEIRHVLEQMSTPQLISVFEPAIREHLKHRELEGDFELTLSAVKRTISRENIMEIAALLPQVMAELKESRHYQPSGQELLSHEPPTASDVHLVHNVVVPSDSNPPLSSKRTSFEQPAPLPPVRDPTVLHGLYTAGIGQTKTVETRFDISEGNYVRALAWARRTLAFDQSNEHLMYHFKTVLTSDFRDLLDKLRSLNILEPSEPPTEGATAESQKAFKTAQMRYHQIVAQSAYKLPTVWPSNADFLADLNREKSRELAPTNESELYIDVTEMIRKGSNVFTLVEFKDMRKYTFCLFEKHPSAEEIEEAAQL